MIEPNVYVSFDYSNDRRYKYMLKAWNAKSPFNFVFSEITPKDINPSNIARIKAAISVKIKSADYTLVIVGKDANRFDKDSDRIGYRNWINFELAQSKSHGHKIVAVKLDSADEAPEELKDADVKWVSGFTEKAISRALNKTS